MNENVELLKKEIVRERVEQKRKQKYKHYLTKDFPQEILIEEIVFDLKKVRDDSDKILEEEAKKILPEILKSGWSEKLKVNLKYLRCYGKEPHQLWYESKRELDCCEWRKKHIFSGEVWEVEEYYEQSNSLLAKLGNEMATNTYQTWLVLFSDKSCSNCENILGEIKQIKEEDIVEAKFKEHKDYSKEINLSPERIWVFRCKKECSICPSLVSEMNKESNKFTEHFLEWLRENATKYMEAETLLFNCPKCDQKWAVAGEIPTEIRLAFHVNKGESYEGSKLNCYSCNTMENLH